MSQAQAAATALLEAMQDVPEHLADLQRAKCLMGLGRTLTGAITEEQVEGIFVALESLSRPTDHQRTARSLSLMEDGPYCERLARLAR